MVTQALVIEEYQFRLSFGGYDHLEGMQSILNREIGKDVVYIYNKVGSTIMMLIVEDLSMVRRANIISKVEEICELEFIQKKDALYRPDYLQNLKGMFGEKLAVK